MRKAIFLDRDGVINESHTHRVKFVNKAEDFYLLPGVADAIAMLRGKGYMIFIVTNQGGIGAGFMTIDTLDAIHTKMKLEILSENPYAIIDGIAYCPHHTKAGCTCRKPEPGMILALAEKYNVDLSQSYMVGDMESDIQAGKAARCRTFMVDQNNSLLDFAKSI